MNKRVLNSLTELERNLVAETDKQAMAELDEDTLLELHTRIRRARTKYVKLYRRQASARVETQGGRGKAFPKNQRSRDKARSSSGPSPGSAAGSTCSPNGPPPSSRPSGWRRLSAPAAVRVPTGPRPDRIRRRSVALRRPRPPVARSAMPPPGPRGPGDRPSATARERRSALSHRSVVDPGSVHTEERAVLPLLSGPAVVDEVSAELDGAFGVEGAATGMAEDLQAGPAQTVAERHPSWSVRARPGAEEVRLVPQHVRAVARPHQLLSGHGVGPARVQAAAAVVVRRRQTARAGHHAGADVTSGHVPIVPESADRPII